MQKETNKKNFNYKFNYTAGKGQRRCKRFLAKGFRLCARFNNKLRPTDIETAAVTADAYPVRIVLNGVGFVAFLLAKLTHAL